ncbi:endonuclease/exonuclease/phosphatase family protein [Actinomadura violacea]|uniref:Endonuclease/exonuclease/phosphatase family protein n=1 Tax=Actinomadura violacea TaxID=2819934 RepID=A0ABS3S8W1_9ACTN|nr:endonuclease/exonuclease/phosphatase family protein [Actinomadura violacea]MBO2464665.1 endonuclease/exonuclease/phosphatase family protein [Actinomadura violacea]
MRAPRALIPLLSVCGAAAVVTAAGVGADIDGLPGGGPAHADGAVRKPPPKATVTALTWNVCGTAEPGCPLGARPAELAKRVADQLHTTEVGGRKVRANAAFLQEICSGQVEALKKASWFASWSWEFAAYPDGRACAGNQGRPGVAIGARAALTGARPTRLPSPSGNRRVALCGEAAAWRTRLCVTQFSSPAEDPQGEWRRKQARAYADLAGTGTRVIAGGDLAATPENAALDPLYRAYAECDQSGTARTGGKTLQDWKGTALEKDDYLFITKSATASCSVPASATKASDHRPLSAVIRFR